jgi:hypothetical protein
MQPNQKRSFVMSPVIRISDNLHKRLEKHAVGFDTPASVIERLLNKIEGVDNAEGLKKAEKKDLLPIFLEPSNIDKFKEKLLEHRKASICIRYSDGEVEEKPWNASRFTVESDVIGNLRSRQEFRQGAWQERDIKDVTVKIDY